jgi:hypothetical protein
MQLIKATGENINNIVEKGQRELEERKWIRGAERMSEQPANVG